MVRLTRNSTHTRRLAARSMAARVEQSREADTWCGSLAMRSPGIPEHGCKSTQLGQVMTSRDGGGGWLTLTM